MKENYGKLFAYLALVSQLGFVMIACIVIGFLAGYYIDKFFGTMPVFFIFFLIIGIASGFKTVYDIIMKTNIKDKLDD